MKKHLLSMLLTLVAAIPAFAQTPVLDFTVDGQSTDAAVTADGTGGWTAPNLTIDGLTFSDITLETNSDPFVHYSYSVENTSGSSMAYSTTASTPTTLAAGAYTVNSSLGVSVTDFSSDPAGVSVWPNSGPLQEALADSTDVTPADLGSGTISEATFGDTNTQNFTQTPTPYTLASPVTTGISTYTSFNLSDGADVGITGFFQMVAAPEPSSFFLGLLSVGTFALITARARRA